ncbi:MAG: hypothetical protein ACYDH9_03095 [Limisphaerales bacterium]
MKKAVKPGVKCAQVALLWLAQIASADGSVGPWILRNPPAVIAHPSGIAYGNGQFVIVGSKGAVVTSPDGLAWTPQYSGTTNGLAAVSYGNGQFVAVGGTNILTSADGLAWTPQYSGTTNGLNGIGSGGGEFVAVGLAGAILTSPDGMNWTPRNSGTTYPLYAVGYGTNLFVAVGDAGTILTSPDAGSWTQQGTNQPYRHLRGIAYGNQQFVVVEPYGTISTSADGVNWNSVYGGLGILSGVMYGGSQFVLASGGEWGFPGVAATSFDGGNWSGHEAPSSTNLVCTAYGNGLYVTVDANGTIYTSTKGDLWSGLTPTTDLFAVAYGNGQYAAVGDAGTILTSPDAATWTPRDSGVTNRLQTIAGNENGFAILLGGPTILTSPDGIRWTSRSLGITNELYGIAAGAGEFVAVGQRGTLAYSTDGVNWSAITIEPNFNPIAITYGSDGFFAIGNFQNASGPYGATLTSADGGTWALTPLRSMTWATNALVAAGNGRLLVSTRHDAVVLLSTNGLTWTTTTYYWPAGDDFSEIAYGNGLFLIPALVFAPGCLCPRTWGVAVSLDGIKWGGWGIQQYGQLNGIAFVNHRFIAVGPGGVIWESATAPDWGPVLLLANGSLQATVTGLPGTNCVVEVSTNLTAWAPLTNVTATNGTAQFNDPSATNFTRRFYRAVSP